MADQEQRFIKSELGEMTEVVSMCPKCEGNGHTRIMITKIPHFREVIVSSFDCDECTESNREVQFGGQVGPKKVKYHLEVTCARDLDRQVVKSGTALLSIPQLELEMEPQPSGGSLNTVEGVLQRVKDGLEAEQPLRKVLQPELHGKIAAFVNRVSELQTGERPFDLWLEDPAGNSYIESLGVSDPQLTKFEITRSQNERDQLGLLDDPYNMPRTEAEEAAVDQGTTAAVTEFDQPCPGCAAHGTVKIHETTIPHFGSIVIMAFRCATCDFRSNEIKSTGVAPEKGKVATLRVESATDLSRDVLKSDTTKLQLPELDFEMQPGSLGGLFTTVEGLIAQVHDTLSSLRQLDFERGDAEHLHGATLRKQAGCSTMSAFLSQLADMRDGKAFPFTIVLEDPAGMVHIQAVGDEDTQLSVVEFEASEEERERLGI